MLKEEVTEEEVMVFTSGSCKHRLAPLQWTCSNSCQVATPEQGTLSAQRLSASMESSACHLDVNVLYINDEMSKGGLCPETVSSMLICSC